MSFAFHLPINSVSFGQVSIALLRETFKRGLSPPLFLIGAAAEMSTQVQGDGFENFHSWLDKSLEQGEAVHKRKDPTFKLWHIQHSMSSYSERQLLLTFYELDSPTKTEINILKNNSKVLVTSQYTSEIFNSVGVDSSVITLGFDKYNFHKTEKNYGPEDRVTFNLAGKFEKRKHHEKILKLWCKKYGNNKKYFLNCALYNNFLKPEQNNAVVARALEGQQYYNVNFLGYMEKNDLYNDFLNAGDIIIGMSGGEGWGLPEFHSVGLGKHAVILNASAYKEWANSKNAVLVAPNGKIPAYDGLFFREDAPTNQGNIFDFDGDEFLDACDEAVKRVESNKVNESGLKIQKEFPLEKTLDSILKHVEAIK